MFNKVVLVGHLARDIELKYTQSSLAIGKTAIATSRKFKTAAGEQKDEVMFIDITFFGRSAEVANQYLRKGSKILVEGRLVLDQWDDAATGQKRSKHQVTVETMQMLDSKGDNVGGQGAQGGNSYNQNFNQPPQQQQNQQQQYSQPQQQQQQYGQQNQQQQYAKPQQQQEQNIPVIDIDEDEIPF